MKTLTLATALALVSVSLSAPAFSAEGSAFRSFDGNGIHQTVEKRRKKRIPGGSGCDDPRDIIEHPECSL